MTSSTLTLVYRDVESAASWLQRVFRFHREDARNIAVKEDRQIFLRLNDMVVGLAAELAPQKLVSPQSISFQTTAGCQIAVDDLDEFYRHVAQQGATIILEPQGEDGTEREFACRDLEGHVWVFVDRFSKSTIAREAADQPASARKLEKPPGQPGSSGRSIASLLAAAVVAATGSSAITVYAMRSNTELAQALLANRYAGGPSGQTAGQSDGWARLASDLAPLRDVHPKLSALSSDLTELHNKVAQGFALVDQLSTGSGARRDNDALVASVDELKRRLSAAETASAAAAQKMEAVGSGLDRQLTAIAQKLDSAARARNDALTNLDQKFSAIADANGAHARSRDDTLQTVSKKLDDLSSKLGRIPTLRPEDQDAKSTPSPALIAPESKGRRDAESLPTGSAATGLASATPSPSLSIQASHEPATALSGGDLVRACAMAIRQHESTERELEQARLGLAKGAEERLAAQRRERELQNTLDREIKSKQFAWKAVADSKRRVACEPAEGTAVQKKKQADGGPPRIDGD